MDLNIFKIPPSHLAALQQGLEDKGFTLIRTQLEGGWLSEFLFLEGPEEVAGWVRVYEKFFEGRDLPTRKSQSAVYLFQNDESCYAITHGAGHYYVRPLCDYDFGTDLAKRIADENEVKQTAAKQFHSRRKKEHRLYRANTRLELDSGESIEMIHTAIITSKRRTFGRSGKFGPSAIISPSIGIDEIADLLSAIDSELKNPELFALPREEVITNKAEVAYYDLLLIEEITAKDGLTDFTSKSLDLCGVDFIFGKNGRFSLKHPQDRKPLDFKDSHDLTIDDLRLYINSRGLTGREILNIRVTKYNDDGDQPWDPDLKLKESLDYIVDSHRVILSEGKWKRFNQYYLAFIDNYVRGIEVEETEDNFKVISETETNFNASDQIRRAGYKNADKDFSIAAIAPKTPVEAWDLSKGRTVYALKFGTAQKLGYVCAQASAVLRLIKHHATIEDVPKFDKYCLWFGYMAKRPLASIADTNSLILKQSIKEWASLCRDVGVTPVIKISRHTGRQLILA
ncbi:DUF6119 family protein [Nocardia wallacei]|uniref:DUF6119 family protein n=1 Tax=Nocardia wallacei TaxID=480035 RepID=UPI002458DF6A|nr:DUF6119 family protein [Nocardia wallacei]